jgi:membrane protein
MLAYFESSIGWKEVLRRTYREVIADDAQALASELAYYFFLALFPALLCVIAFASFFPLQNLTDDVVRLLGRFAPAEMLDLIKQQMVKIAEGRQGGLLSLGLLGAIWSSSGAMVAAVSAMNRAYDIDESRPWWKVRITAIGITLGLAVFVLIAFTLIVAGPQLADFLARHIGFGSLFVWSWKILQWPLAFVLVSTAFGIIYYYAPDAEQEWVWITPGAATAAVLWFVGTLIFRFYAVNFGNYTATYGTIGGIILMLLWFFLTGLVIIIGAEMNAEIEHASPWGKAPGEKVPGQKKRIGLAAFNHFHHKSPTTGDRERTTSEPLPAPVSTPLALPAYSPPTFVERLISYAAVIFLWKRRAKT